ncbi:MAG: DNA recombination protein RmuC [Acidobacteria bacterium]|nr:DNA recombination protein RmuC [Acidobacteriota bacterium]
METQLMYVISIVLGVAFGYFVASMMFRNERNGLIAQGQQAGEAERAQLAEQAKVQETRVAEIEKEREQERAEIDRLREQNEKLKVLHAEADERVNEARRMSDEYWQQVVADTRTAANGGVPPVDVENSPEVQERLRQAVEQARMETGESWQRTVSDVRAQAEDRLRESLAEAREQAEQRVAEAVALSRQEADAEWGRKLEAAQQEAAAAAAAVPAELAAPVADEAHWQQVLEEARQQAEQRVAEAVALVRQEADASHQALLAGERLRQEDLWQQALAEARRQAEFEREQAAGVAAEAESRIQALTEELNALRQQASEAAPATAAAPDQSAMLDTFRAVAAEALNANNQKFLDLARVALERIQETARPEPSTYTTAVNELMGPIRDTLAKVDSNIGQLEKERQDAMANLTEMVTGLIQQGKELRRDTSGLARALHPLGGHGRWSEVQLRRVVELAGMVEHCDYEKREHVNGDGTHPEMIVHLPNHRDIVVDASVSLTAYLESLETSDEAGRAGKLREHAAAIRSHLQKLSGAAYWSQFASTPEFVVAFLPNETVFSAALEEDPSLIEFGAEHRVILATPTTLIALLKATAYGWRQQQLADNANTVRELGKTLYARLNAFTGHLDDLRRNLERSVESYNRSVASLESRVLVSARRFHDLSEIETPEIPVLEPVETLPRSLHALESATIRPDREFEEIPEIGAAIKDSNPLPVAEDIPVIELPIVPPLAPVIVSEPRVVSEAHVVREARIVREANFVVE